MKIAIIGAGNMGGALARGLALGTKVAERRGRWGARELNV